LPFPVGDAVCADGSAPRPSAQSGPRGSGQPPLRTATFDVAEVDRIPVVAVSGDLDIAGAESFRSTLERAARTESAVVVVSLADASYMDSHSIRVLYQFGRRLATNRRSLVLVVPPTLPFARVLHVSGLDRAYRVEPSIERAVAGVAGPVAPATPARDDP
jgi:anti-anti-sigma factor